MSTIDKPKIKSIEFSKTIQNEKPVENYNNLELLSIIENFCQNNEIQINKKQYICIEENSIYSIMGITNKHFSQLSIHDNISVVQIKIKDKYILQIIAFNNRRNLKRKHKEEEHKEQPKKKQKIDKNPSSQSLINEKYEKLKNQDERNQILGFWILRCCINFFNYENEQKRNNAIKVLDEKISLLENYLSELKIIIDETYNYDILLSGNESLQNYIHNHINNNHKNEKDEILIWYRKIQNKEYQDLSEVFDKFSILQNEIIVKLNEQLKRLHEQNSNILKNRKLYIF